MSRLEQQRKKICPHCGKRVRTAQDYDFYIGAEGQAYHGDCARRHDRERTSGGSLAWRPR